MPGAYAHITLVNLAKEPHRLEEAGVPIPAIRAVLENFRFCELGAVSPDYPYLHLGASHSRMWADAMHYERTGEPLRCAPELVKKLNGQDQSIALAWIFGYAAHVMADITIHPVVELCVGPYQQNQTAHRVCELNQDAYIFQRLNLDEIGRSEHLDSGIWGCCDTPNSGRLHRTIEQLWRQMLSLTYPEKYAESEPEVDKWHAGFKRAVDLAEEGNKMPLFARHVAVNSGLTYPAVRNIASKYITRLATPDGVMHYDELFDKALSNVVWAWTLLGRAIFEEDDSYRHLIKDWNLDTGKDHQGKFAVWPDQEKALNV